MLKKEFSKLKEYPPSQEYIADIAKKVLLTPEVTRLWWDHLHTVLLNRKRGAKKAAATRAKARKPPTATLQPAATEITNLPESTNPTLASQSASAEIYVCGTCMKEYSEEAENEELWIGCDQCDKWFCGGCEELKSPPPMDIYLCVNCRQ